MSSIGHTFLQQQLMEDMQKTFASPLKNTVNRGQRHWLLQSFLRYSQTQQGGINLMQNFLLNKETKMRN